MATTTDETGALAAEDVFSVLLGAAPESPPPALARNFRLLREAHPRARHHVLGEDDVRALLAAHFSAEVGAAFETLKPHSYRSNLARYACLFVYGGLYVDLGVRFVSALRAPGGAELVAFRDEDPGSLTQGVLLAKAGRPELKTAIDMIVANVAERFYGAHPTEVSGPRLFARAVALHGDEARYAFGRHLAVDPTTRLKNFVFLSPEGEIVALGKSGATGDVSYLGLAASNNYVEMWRARRVYGEA